MRPKLSLQHWRTTLVDRRHISLITNQFLHNTYQRPILCHDTRRWCVKGGYQRLLIINRQRDNMSTYRVFRFLMLVDNGEIRDSLTKEIQDHRTPPTTCGPQGICQPLQVFRPYTGGDTLLRFVNQFYQACLNTISSSQFPEMPYAIRPLQRGKLLFQFPAASLCLRPNASQQPIRAHCFDALFGYQRL